MYNMSDSFWETTYRQNIAKMIGVCCRYTQNRQTAEDLAHDAFLVAIDKVSSFENKGPFEAWLRRIVVNVALQYLREQKRQEKWEEAHAYHTIANELQEENPANDQRGFSEAELLEVIGQLPEHHRLVFNLYVVDNFTHAQIATRLGISEGTSKSHLARARKKIRELLKDKLRKDKERKRAFAWLMFSYPFRHVDHLVAGKLRNLAIRPQRRLSIANTNSGVPGFKPSGISYGAYMKTGLMTIATAVFLAGGSNVSDQANSRNIVVIKRPTTDSAHDRLPDRLLFSASKAATISDNPVIVEKTKHSEPMKNLSTLGGLIVASLALDTANLTTDLPVVFKNHPLTVGYELVAKPESVGLVVKQNADLTSGSFYASQLLWSGKDGKLYFLGDHVKVDVNRNKFAGSGKFTFLDKVHYLVVDGVAMKQNETIRLQEKKYNLVSLNDSDGARKYGENGKLGVLEITLAE
ncbi:hypothetical protein GCM10007423_10930 [Dyadobacter endophyticus]|uniref:Sigma-70 family RNA polymerase sigma factor n=2 Tax=Dyadobacter endophyticus TaxID=1749036 RepID=A0ABQ1YHG1_9BACT|nr:hypothetical protein GCM10007423_10930 [Dyadobacter endophyticus]